MKIWLAVIVACTLAFIAGRFSVRYSVPALAFSDLRAICLNYREPREEDLSAIRPYLERATWVNSRPFWKEPWNYTLKDGRKLSLDFLTALFAVEGVDGYYKMRVTDEAAFREAFSKRTTMK